MSFARPRQPLRRAAMPLAPMLDVLFLLLIFFATTTTFRAGEQQIDVALPVADTGQPRDTLSTQIVVNIQPDDRIVVADRVMPLHELRSLFARLVEDFPNERVVIRGDATANYGRIIEVWDAARLAGVRQVSLATMPPAPNPEG